MLDIMSVFRTQSACFILLSKYMLSIFDASNNIEAHLVMHQLQQAGINARIEGEYLQGGIGELAAAGNIRVLVEPKDEEEARQVIADWEAAEG